MKLPIYELTINDDLNDNAEVSYISLVDSPAIKKPFLAFKEDFINPSKGEHKDEFLPRCISYVVGEGKDPDQAVAICNSIWEQHFNGGVSFDYDDTLTTAKGKELAAELISEGTTVYIVSARHSIGDMADTAKELGIPESRVFATGTNEAKIAKVKELGVTKHYDNNLDVVKQLGTIGATLEAFVESYTDYPQAASENAKTALRWAEENGWGSCGTPVGKKRANDLAAGRPLSRDTIARMAAFERHRQNSQRDLGDGCGRLMWLAWGGDEGIAWAQRKLQQIDRQANNNMQFSIVNEDQRIISGPLLIADMLIYRNNEVFGEHYVKFSAETIKQIAVKFAKRKNQDKVNLMHDDSQRVSGLTLFESFIVDKSRGIAPMKGYEDVADGSWFGSFFVENEEVWSGIKQGIFKGFSVEGIFDYMQPISPEEDTLKKIERLLNEIIDD